MPDGTRTDTIMLLNVNSAANTVNLVSIPRDTFVSGGYNVPKINSAYGWAGKGEDGMQELMDRVTETIGFTPDGYLLVDLDSFIELVDLMGGVKFDVPMDMRYSDPAQNLTIDLTAGMQKLDGQQAMGPGPGSAPATPWRTWSGSMCKGPSSPRRPSSGPV